MEKKRYTADEAEKLIDEEIVRIETANSELAPEGGSDGEPHAGAPSVLSRVAGWFASVFG